MHLKYTNELSKIERGHCEYIKTSKHNTSVLQSSAVKPGSKLYLLLLSLSLENL